MDEKQYLDSPVWGVAENIAERLATFTDAGRSDSRYAELNKKLQYFQWILAKNDPALVSESELSTITTHLKGIINYLPNNAHNWNYFANIQKLWASVFSVFPYPRLQKIFRSEANEAIEQVQAHAEVLNSRLSDISIELEKAANRAEELSSRQQIELNKVESELGELKTSIGAQQKNWEAELEARVTKNVSEWREAFSRSETERKSEAQARLDEMTSRLKSLTEDSSKLSQSNENFLEEIQRTTRTRNEEILANADEVLGKINGVYDEASQNVLAGGFVVAAGQEEQTFRRYAISAAVLMVASSGALVWMWFNMQKVAGSVSVYELLAKLPISLVILVPAFYLASLASRARTTSLSLRSRGLRIKAFDAYLAASEDSERVALREKLVDEFFRERQEPAKKGFSFPFGGGKMVEITEKLVDKIPNGN